MQTGQDLIVLVHPKLQGYSRLIPVPRSSRLMDTPPTLLGLLTVLGSAASLPVSPLGSLALLVLSGQPAHSHRPIAGRFRARRGAAGG